MTENNKIDIQDIETRKGKMARKRERQKRYIEKGMIIDLPDEESKKKGKRRIRKPKMPARIKSTPRARQK